jgi:predicted dehydrogenase
MAFIGFARGVRDHASGAEDVFEGREVTMKFLIAGFGSIAKRHLRQLKAIDPALDVAVLRQPTSVSDLGEFQALVSRVFLSEAEALAFCPDAVLVTNPSPFHLSTAMAFGRQGSHLFIEKPLSDDLNGVDALEQLVAEKKLVVQVGYVLRFMEPFLAVKKFMDSGRLGKIFSLRAAVGQNLRTWRTGQDYRRSVTASPELGGGVVLELSHELDYALWFLGAASRVGAMTGAVSDLGVTVEDVADIQLGFKSGAVGNIHLDMFDHARNRSCRIVGEKGTLVWSMEDDYKVRFFDAASQQWTAVWDGRFSYDQMFRAQMEHFIECIRTRQEPRVSLAQGRDALMLALAVKRSARERREVKL